MHIFSNMKFCMIRDENTQKFIYLPSLALNISTRIFDWIGFIHDPSLLCWHKHMLGLYIIYPRYKIIQLCVDHTDYLAGQCRRGFDCHGFADIETHIYIYIYIYIFRNDHLTTFKTMCNWATYVWKFLYNHESSSHANLMSCISVVFQHFHYMILN